MLNVGDIIRYYKGNHHGIIVRIDNTSKQFLYYVDWFDAINTFATYRETQLVKVSS
jgi:hypothetical protein